MGVMDSLTGLLLQLPAWAGIALVSLFVALFTSIVYKYTTNQEILKKIREEMSDLRKQIKNSSDKVHAATLNKQIMEKSFQQMRQSMKSMVVTIIPLLLLFSWLQGSLQYVGAAPGQEVTVTVEFESGATGTIELIAEGLTINGDAVQDITDEVSWTVSGDIGEYTLEYVVNNEVITQRYIISNEGRYTEQQLRKSSLLSFRGGLDGDGIVKRIVADLEGVHPFGTVSIFGWVPGVIGAYIIFVTLFTFPVRRLLKIH